MKDIYLKFPSEAEGSPIVGPYMGRDVEGFSVQVLGPIEDTDGWHVNMLVPGEIPEDLVPYLVVPKQPRAVFWGYGPQ